LGALISSAKEQHDHGSFFREINPVTRAVIDSKFLNAITYAMAVAEISQTDPVQPYPNLRASFEIPE